MPGRVFSIARLSRETLAEILGLNTQCNDGYLGIILFSVDQKISLISVDLKLSPTVIHEEISWLGGINKIYFIQASHCSQANYHQTQNWYAAEYIYRCEQNTFVYRSCICQI